LTAQEGKYCVCPDGGPINALALYGRHAPLHLEIGCGAGDALLSMASAHPENDYLGIEVYRPGVGNLLRRLDTAGNTNARVLMTDAVPALEELIDDECIEAAYIFFPDPWPKKRHHKRRLIQAPFARQLARKLMPHGRVFIATDWNDYAEQILAVMDSNGYVNLAGAGATAPRPRWRPITRYERRALRLGHIVKDFVFALDK
jgi:tRNA (guanine-N7-)-methyltransferase